MTRLYSLSYIFIEWKLAPKIDIDEDIIIWIGVTFIRYGLFKQCVFFIKYYIYAWPVDKVSASKRFF